MAETKTDDSQNSMTIKAMPKSTKKRLISIQAHYMQCLGRKISLPETIIRMINRFEIKDGDCE